MKIYFDHEKLEVYQEPVAFCGCWIESSALDDKIYAALPPFMTSVRAALAFPEIAIHPHCAEHGKGQER